jgi:hypothetical protein
MGSACDMQFTSKDWMKAISEGRFASADFIAAHLPPVRLDKAPPRDNRDRFAVCGEISDSSCKNEGRRV